MKIYQVLNILYQLAAVRKIFFELFVTNDFYNKVAEETNKYAALSQRKAGTVDNNWEDTNAEEIQACIGILIYKGLTYQRLRIIFKVISTSVL
jgi:hypothetical protein